MSNHYINLRPAQFLTLAFKVGERVVDGVAAASKTLKSPHTKSKESFLSASFSERSSSAKSLWPESPVVIYTNDGWSSSESGDNDESTRSGVWGINSSRPPSPNPPTADSSGNITCTVDDNNRELVVVVYSGSAAMVDGRFHLVTLMRDGNKQPRPIRQNAMGFCRKDHRLRAVRLFNFNEQRHLPSPSPSTAPQHPNSEDPNMVMAALGPVADKNSNKWRVMVRMAKRDGKIVFTTIAENERPWSTRFLETSVSELEKSGEVGVPLSAMDLYCELSVAYWQFHNRWQYRG
ncbi:hypothetical protein B0H66DRAFT_598258 [Apodospora peruviana]|uniref:Uncharacterized protein n=1 Tax=Apodospora peruviana TaxID=516989 RepID=A0AAE0ITL7_9PEZI|nr:hypothetical protein B0H66DRAFT_598258 [Apodospora peruviana]